MGMDLSGPGGRYLGVSGGTWRRLLELAARHGWEPRGTLANRDMIRSQLCGRDWKDEGVDPALDAQVEQTVGEWKGGYDANECQIVTA